ncbi:MAG: GatB/YqeY domain-containing protein [Gammaproteobacteria bacterium]
MKAALRAGEKLELSALRMALAAIKKQQIEDRAELSDAAVIGLLGKLIKQGRDAEEQFQAAGRAELAAKEAAEVAVFERYMPQAMTDAEITDLIERTIETTGASSIKEMGKVMAAIKAEAAGRADLGAISARVRQALGAG